MQKSTENAASLTGEWAKLWFDMLSPLNPWMMPFNMEGTLPEMGRQMQSAQLKWWNEFLGRFLRSPDFLETMKNSLAAAVSTRKEMNDWLSEARHGLQGVTGEDIDHLSQLLRRQEEQISTGVRKILRRLDELADRIAALEHGGPAEHRNNDSINGRSTGSPQPRPRRRSHSRRTGRSEER